MLAGSRARNTLGVMWRVVSDSWQKSWRSHRSFIPSSPSRRDVEHQHQHQHEGKIDHPQSPDNNGKDRRHYRNERLMCQTAASRLPSRRRKPISKILGEKAWIGVLAGGVVLATLLVFVDVMKSRLVNAEKKWEMYYMRAVVGDYYHWQMGWRLEDLAKQTTNQMDRMSVLYEVLKQIPPSPPAAASAASAAMAKLAGNERSSRDNEAGVGEEKVERTGDVTAAVWAAKVLAVDEDLNRIVAIECSTRPGKYVQVGMHSMEASPETSCKVYSMTEKLDPHALFEKIELGEGRFALRAFSNGRFVRVVPPEPEAFSMWNVWKLEVGAPEVGLPEVFQMRDGKVYSEVMHGYLSCSGAGREAELKGFVGEFMWYSEDNYQLVFHRVSEETIERARILRDISRAVNYAQRRQAEEYLARNTSARYHPGIGDVGQAPIVERADGEPEIIAICVPMTSRGTDMNSTHHSPVWKNAFQTFLSTTEWNPPRFRYHWYFGFDAGDPIYDGPDAVKSLDVAFQLLAKKEFRNRGLDADALLKGFMRLEAKYYYDFDNAPSYVVSALIQDAYDDGCDYFYQINDDTVMNSAGWAETFTAVLRTNPLGRNVGVTGPSDTNNRRILTHAFVHRRVTHLDIFGRYFPLSFRNWWSDDWISNVYGSEHTLRDHIVTVTHDVASQKLEAHNRYEIDFTAEQGLGAELREGHVKLSRWLKARGLPPATLPMVCGYAPLVDSIFDFLEESRKAEQASAAAERQEKEIERAAAALAVNWQDGKPDRDMGGGAPVDLDSPERQPKSHARRPPEPPAPPEV
ncbi:unnamed protein product [Ascophyllum nodosum]